MPDEIRTIVGRHGGLSEAVEKLDGDTDLYRAGMNSHASVNVMLALESHFDVEFPDSMLTRSVFQSISSIERALLQLRHEIAA